MAPKILMLTYRFSKPRYTLVGEVTPLVANTLRSVAMQWLLGLPTWTIWTFGNLAILFISQFAENKAKRLEVADLFDIKQAKGENLKEYLTRFNNAMIRGLRAGQFSDTLTLRRLSNMEKIRARAEKHTEAEEDLADQLEVEHQPLAPQAKPRPSLCINQDGGYKT
ncbi:hypothetical protein CR513_04770, partial [Mucuna pruriens]